MELSDLPFPECQDPGVLLCSAALKISGYVSSDDTDCGNKPKLFV